MQNLFESLAARYPTPARCAAALGISRQAYSQARKRRRLSESATIRAAALLDLDPGASLLANATAKDAPAPVPHPTADRAPKSRQKPPDLYYVKSGNDKIECRHASKKNAVVHSITSDSQQEAIDLIRWVLAVAKLPADSPRFPYYVSRWRVPEKITTAKKAGTFSKLIANCPPIDPAWVRLVPAAIAAYKSFIEPKSKPPESKPASSGKCNTARNKHRRAA